MIEMEEVAAVSSIWRSHMQYAVCNVSALLARLSFSFPWVSPALGFGLGLGHDWWMGDGA